jgi:hypothetical protein
MLYACLNRHERVLIEGHFNVGVQHAYLHTVSQGLVQVAPVEIDTALERVRCDLAGCSESPAQDDYEVGNEDRNGKVVELSAVK